MMAAPSAKNPSRFFASAGVLLLSALCCAPGAFAQQAASASSSNQPAPKIVVAQTSYDFGNIFRGEGISYVFVIKNEGKADLLIEEFAPS
jgi:hypothetical protein